MTHSIEDLTLALAGIFQATALVQDVARRGHADPEACETSLYSLFQTNAETCAAVYNEARGLSLGLGLIAGRLAGKQTAKDLEITRYALNVLHLERKLSAQPRLLSRLGQEIGNLQAQAAQYGPTHPPVVAALSALYQETISTLTPRIVVNGEQGHLSQSENADKVRALLLAAIRSAILWRQCGGRRWQLLFKRRQIIEAAQRLRA